MAPSNWPEEFKRHFYIGRLNKVKLTSDNGSDLVNTGLERIDSIHIIRVTASFYIDFRWLSGAIAMFRQSRIFNFNFSFFWVTTWRIDGKIELSKYIGLRMRRPFAVEGRINGRLGIVEGCKATGRASMSDRQRVP